jgi:hypothetical protein
MLTIRPTRNTDRLPETPDFEFRSGGLGVGRIHEEATSRRAVLAGFEDSGWF